VKRSGQKNERGDVAHETDSVAPGVAIGVGSG
jgi:hypothetical protein